ncbi:kinase-like domain-containing protein [Ilyonectria robusta]|uniref:kinase-like domain-containing protein n=1 Tax=Ilyonectria robusta TaxID=1079257 RepID=UPI001E8EEA46|nr:kinase-like domain-containing protein [Ilyonectria robusta]KAH8729228.1 kinase-like domain-containing protein [Ilyonectria robusta]
MAALSAPGMMVAPHQHQQSMLDSADKSANSPPLRSNSASSFLSASSPRGFSTDLTDSILEEGGESGSESFVEPVTPISRHSQDFTLQSGQDLADIQTLQSCQPISLSSSTAPIPIPGSNRNSTATSPTKAGFFSSSQSSSRRASNTESTTPRATDTDVTTTGTPLSRRSTRGSTSSFKRTMSSFFRRSTSQAHIAKESAIVDSAPSVASGVSDPTSNGQPRAGPTRRFSMNRSSATTRSNSPPSPGSPLEMRQSAHDTSDRPANGTIPSQNDFTKKNRASTGLTLRGRAVNFVGSTVTRGSTRGNHRQQLRRRASSFDGGSRPTTPIAAGAEHHHDEATYPPERLPWALPPDSGTGAKARRMSLSLPDDFAVDVAELQSEFEYQSKFLGRHGKHLGKGAASKVTLMNRKGYPEELYAVKEFRGKSHRETQQDYEKKIKSEFSIAKSLHHPNVVETIRLCTDHGRWNHVMEYCSEGDLFSLVQKGHLKGEDRKKDRLCLFKQLIQGVYYLHANGIAHRDIKLENLIITKDSKLKITDFGVSEVFCGTHPGLREAGGQCGRNMGDIRLCSPGICGSEPYIAPEVLEKKDSYDPRPLDVWSSAIIMIYLTFGGAIWSRAEKGNTHYDKLVKGWNNWYAKHPEADAAISDTDYPKCYAMDVGVSPPALRRLLLQMLNPNPQKRISISEVLNNRWMKGVECCQVESYDDPALKIDATKKDTTKNGVKKIFCHNHLPPKSTGSHSLGKMPGQAGY